ncbi:MAG: cob(I)yrinic acid a,c-diamide adenosyltransferase [Gammaproteobacteria bacterium]|nr:cob(I)yrinic acid a,c-diamide adenosyltransferase [Gammaproteobacteria bacterium]
MGNRLSKIYTRTGDDGSTGLGDGQRVSKDSPRVEAYGTIDELNSAVGVLRATDIDPAHQPLLAAIQQELFDLGGELSIPGAALLSTEAVQRLEQALDDYNATLPPLKEFVMPGGSAAGAACHMARAICRRAERRLCTLAKGEAVSETAIRYVNRLSDLLFVLARILNSAAAADEVLWQGSKLSRPGNSTA